MAQVHKSRPGQSGDSGNLDRAQRSGRGKKTRISGDLKRPFWPLVLYHDDGTPYILTEEMALAKIKGMANLRQQTS